MEKQEVIVEIPAECRSRKEEICSAILKRIPDSKVSFVVNESKEDCVCVGVVGVKTWDVESGEQYLSAAGMHSEVQEIVAEVCNGEVNAD